MQVQRHNVGIELSWSESEMCVGTTPEINLYKWHTGLLPLTHALCTQQMTSCWVSLGFGAPLAICICHFERVTLAHIYFERLAKKNEIPTDVHWNERETNVGTEVPRTETGARTTNERERA